MILTHCAQCAAPLDHKAPRCGICKTRYCGRPCQEQHWKQGGHNAICQEIKRGGGAEQYHADKKCAEAVAAAVEACADDTKGQTCFICTQALHWKTKEGLVRGCACRGTSGFVHVSCLAEQAKILREEAEANNLDNEAHIARWRRWHRCSLCEQNYNGVVCCALGWACWKTYVGRPEGDVARRSALAQLGLGLSGTDQYDEALTVFQAEADALKRFAPAEEITADDNASNIALCCGELGLYEEALEIERRIYDRDVASGAADTEDSFITAKQLAATLRKLGREAEAKSFLSERVVEAERALGPDNETVLCLRRNYAIALSDAPGHLPLSDIIKARAILEDVLSRRRRIWGAKDEVVEEHRILLDGVGMTIEDDSGYIDW